MTTTITFKVSGAVQIERDALALRVVFTIIHGSTIIRGVAPMAYTLPVDQQIEVQVSYVDAEGNAVDLPQGNVTWEVSDAALLGVVPDTTDDQKCMVTPVGPVGTAQLTCTGKNPDGSAVIATLDMTLVPGNAITGTIQPVGSPTPKP